ncbi:MAG TPA: virulence-associated protein E, partial [Lachnospiraceae bacterium]|nr:virulence-associated protein E [Lachnospiraceae bacterium]
MQEQSAQAENGLWNAVGEVLDTEMITVEDVLESLDRTQKGNVKSSIENCMTILYKDPVLRNAVCKNELTGKIDIVKPLFWKRNGSCITDVDMYQIQR